MWRRHPLTHLVFSRYLPDFRSTLERAALNAWMGGTLHLNAEQEARGHLIMAHQIENLDLVGVRSFYGLASDEPNTSQRLRP